MKYFNHKIFTIAIATSKLVAIGMKFYEKISFGIKLPLHMRAVIKAKPTQAMW